MDRGLAAIGLAPRRRLPVCVVSLAQRLALLRLSGGRGSSIPAPVRPTALDRTSGDCPAIPGLMLPARCRADDRRPDRCPPSPGRPLFSPVRPAASAGLWSDPRCARHGRIPAWGTALWPWLKWACGDGSRSAAVGCALLGLAAAGLRSGRAPAGSRPSSRGCGACSGRWSAWACPGHRRPGRLALAGLLSLLIVSVRPAGTVRRCGWAGRGSSDRRLLDGVSCDCGW